MFGKLTRWAAQNSKFNQWGLCTLIHFQLVSVGVCWTSVGLSTVVWSFLVDFACLFGDIPVDSPVEKSVGLTSPASMHRKVTGKLQQLQS